MNNSTHTKDQKIHKVIADDIKNNDYLTNLGKEIKELTEFMLTEEEQKELKSMKKIRRGFNLAWKLMNSLILKLTPTRRFFILIAILFFLLDWLSKANFLYSISALLIILFILMLELKDKLLAKEELDAGKIVQESLMPERSPELNGWKLWLYSRSANDVGGDLIDYIKTDEENFAIVLGDVSGKGLTAALHAAKLQATVRALLPEYPELAELNSKINKAFRRYSAPNFFATLFLAKFETFSGIVRFVNAGHIPPILLKNNCVSGIEKCNPAIGIMSDVNFKEQDIQLEKGDTLFIYSDGVTEAKNEGNEFFGEKRLTDVLQRQYSQPLDALGSAVLNEIEKFIQETKLNDDITIALIRKL